MKIKKTMLMGTAIVLGLSGWMETSPIGQAKATDELEEELSEIRESQAENQEEAEISESELEEIEEDQAEISDDIRELDASMNETVAEIAEQEEEITEVETRIEELEDEVEEIEARIEERDELLKERAVTMYKSGGGTIEYIEVLLGAQSFGDFIERVRALTTIAEQDREILDEHIADHELLEEKKTEVEENLASLESHVEELETLQADLEVQVDEKNEVMAGLNEEEQHLLDELVEIENEEEILQQQEIATQNEIERIEQEERERKEQERKEREEQERIEREKEERQEREQQEAEEQQAAEEEATTEESTDSEDTDSSNNDSGSSSESSGTQESGATANVTSVQGGSGELARPATGRITSEHGPRWGRMHNGIDIGQGGRSNVPIVSAESGEVSHVDYMGGYGNTVMVTHQLDGRTVTTLYAHLSSANVSVGDTVSRGEQIGIMGNTGSSTGPHLHFEVHEGGWGGSGVNSVDPMGYIQ